MAAKIIYESVQKENQKFIQKESHKLRCRYTEHWGRASTNWTWVKAHLFIFISYGVLNKSLKIFNLFPHLENGNNIFPAYLILVWWSGRIISALLNIKTYIFWSYIVLIPINIKIPLL